MKHEVVVSCSGTHLPLVTDTKGIPYTTFGGCGVALVFTKGPYAVLRDAKFEAGKEYKLTIEEVENASKKN
jgi:hypothetical protein